MNRNERMAETFSVSRSLESVNFKVVIILALIILGILSNGLRTYLDLTGDSRQTRIEYLDQQVIEMQDTIMRLSAELESCNTGTPMPFIKDAK